MRSRGVWVLCIVAALVPVGAPFADPLQGGIFGDLRYSLDAADDRGPADAPGISSTDNNSIWGLRVAARADGLTAFGRVERFLAFDGVAAVDRARQTYAGLTGRFGTVQYGQFESAYSEAGHKLDLFYNTMVSGTGGASASPTLIGGGASHGLSPLTRNGVAPSSAGGIFRNQIAYTSPTVSGLTGNVALILDESGTGADQHHDYAAGAEFSRSGVAAGAQVLDFRSGNLGPGSDSIALRVYGGYRAVRFGVNLSIERLRSTGSGPDFDFHYLSGWLGLTARTRLALAVGAEESNEQGRSLTLGVFHDLIENFTTWCALRRFDGSGPNAGQVNDVATLGASFRFDLELGR